MRHGVITFNIQTLDTGLSIAANANGSHINLSGDPTVAAPVDGDLWYTGTELNFYDGSSTTDLLAGASTGQWTLKQSTDFSAQSSPLSISGMSNGKIYKVILTYTPSTGTTVAPEINFNSDTASNYNCGVVNYDGIPSATEYNGTLLMTENITISNGEKFFANFEVFSHEDTTPYYVMVTGTSMKNGPYDRFSYIGVWDNNVALTTMQIVFGGTQTITGNITIWEADYPG